MIFPTTFEERLHLDISALKGQKQNVQKISANGCKYHNLCLLVSMRCKSTEELVKKTADEFNGTRYNLRFREHATPNLRMGILYTIQTMPI
ncbi:MAG: hypothetical protein ACLUKN_16185 [Bacilli bacterium]